jgi:hypothetical protein
MFLFTLEYVFGGVNAWAISADGACFRCTL